MWLIACQDGDAQASAIADGLENAGGRTVELVTASELVHGAVWNHQIGAEGVTTTVRLGERAIDSGHVTGALNRLVWLSVDGFEGASYADREYATAEFQALGLSWLASLGERLLNPPIAPGVGSAWWPSCQWRAAALGAGLPVARYESDEAAQLEQQDRFVQLEKHSAVVVDGRLVGAEQDELPGIDPRVLSGALGLDVFEAWFTPGPDGAWELAEVDPLPPLDAVALEAVADALRARERKAS